MDREDVIESHTSQWSDEQRLLYADYLSTQRLDYEPLIQSGDRVVVELNDKVTIVAVKPTATVQVRGKNASVSTLIENPVNGTYCYQDNIFKRRLEGKIDIEAIFAQLEEKELTADFMPTSTNKDLIARPENQKLTPDDIEKMKSTDMSITEIMKEVTNASSTWSDKTEFSQLKWIKKKFGKYNQDISCCQTTPFTLQRVTGQHDGIRQDDHMRDDTFAQMLAMANTGFNSRCIVVDSTEGLLSGAIQRRIGDSGATMFIHCGKNSQQGMTDLNLAREEKRRVISMPYDALPSYGWATKPHDWTTHQRQQIKLHKDALGDKAKNAQDIILPCMTAHAQNFLQHKALSVIICHFTADPLSLFLPLLPHVLPSSPFVLWSPTIEPLAHAMNYLKMHRLASQMHLQDTWYRPLQVLPNRTHPHMNMDATGGFLLWGFTLDYALPQFDENGKVRTNLSQLHPDYTSTNDAFEFKLLPCEERQCSRELDQRSQANNPQNGLSQRSQNQSAQKRKWQPKNKGE